MCTAFVFNGNKTLVGWNLDVSGIEWRVSTAPDQVTIDIADAQFGWLPLFGATSQGDFVAMPTRHPYDRRSDPSGTDEANLLEWNIRLLLGQVSFQDVLSAAERMPFRSLPGITWMDQLTNAQGDVLQIISGEGYRYLPKPRFAILTNFSPFQGEREFHPWMGRDRYQTVLSALSQADNRFCEGDCLTVLKAASQTVCPTAVTMVWNATDRILRWWENRDWETEHRHRFSPVSTHSIATGGII